MKKILIALFLIAAAGAARADVTDPRMGLTEPTVGSLGWGTKLNANFRVIDSSAAVQASSNTFTSTNTFSGAVFMPSLTAGLCVGVDGSGRLISQICSAGSGAPTLEVLVAGIQISSPTASLSFFGNDFNGDLLAGATAFLSLNPGTTNYIHNGSAFQNATMNIASATVTTQLNLPYLTPGGLLFMDTTALNTTNSQRLFWDNSNFFLGIATGTPQANLDVNGPSILRSTVTLPLGTWEASGKVGIATSTVSGSTLTVGGLIQALNGFKFPDSTVQTTANLWQVSGSDMYYSGGKVLVGTNTAIASDTTFTSYRLQTSTVSSRAGVFFNQRTVTGKGAVDGLLSYAVLGNDTLLQATTAQSLVGLHGEADYQATLTQNSAVGIEGIVSLLSTGTVTTAQGVSGSVEVDQGTATIAMGVIGQVLTAGGHIGTASGGYFSLPDTSLGGDITTGAALYVDGVTGGGAATQYGIYAPGVVNHYIQGNLGIGTTAPLSKLHVVNGDIRISTTTGSRGIIFQDGTVQTTASGASAWTISGSDIYNANSGNVGIGTTTPDAKLQIVSSGTVSYSLHVGTGPTSYDLVVSTQGGNVGIGTSAPTSMLHILAPSGSTAGLNLKAVSGQALLDIDANGSSSVLELKRANNIKWQMLNDSSDADKLKIKAVGTTDVMAFTSGGNVGIGTTGPVAKLEIKSSQAGTSPVVQVSSQNGTGYFAVMGGGNVGVGTSSPDAMLHVVDGDIKISTTTGSRGVIFQDGTTQTTAASTTGVALLAATQTFTGANVFNSTVTLRAVPTVTAYFPAGRLFTTTTSSATPATTALTTFYSYDIPANLLNSAGGVLYVEFSGDTAGNSNNKSLFLTVGTSTCTSISALSINNGPWIMSCRIMSSGLSSQTLTGLAQIKATSGSTIKADPTNGTATETSTAIITVQMKGQNSTTSAGDITQKSGWGVWYP